MSDVQSLIGVDLGGTKVVAGKVVGDHVRAQERKLIPKTGSKQEVIDTVIAVIDKVIDNSVIGIGIGVPSVVDVQKGIVYDVQNIPSWDEVPLKSILEEKFELPVRLNNDANCFALGERYYGLGKDYTHFIGLIVGTGMAAGIIIDGEIYNGFNCGAGEFGTIPYLEHHFEYYACGQFFTNVYGIDGQQVYERALDGDPEALTMYDEMGGHLGNAINVILYALDPEMIVLGGSVSTAYRFFKKALWDKINTIAYRTIPERLTIRVSENQDLPILGAAALCKDLVS